MSKTGFIAGAIFVLIVGGGFWFMWGVQSWHFVWSSFRYTWPFLALLFVFPILAFISSSLDMKGATGLFGTLAVVGVLGAIALAFYGPYYTQSKLAEKSVVMEEGSPNDWSFKERAPYAVASETSNQKLGDTLGDSTGSLTAIPQAGEYGQYVVSVERRGMFKGYESTQTTEAPIFGTPNSDAVTFCQFDEDAKYKFSGAVPENNLKRAIYSKTSPSTKVDKDDAFVVCEDETPMLYAPLTKIDGVFLPNRVPAGVAIYNGKTGELNIVENYEGELPVYPASIASDQREAVKATGSFPDYFFNRSGLENTGSDFYSEFNMATADNRGSYYVTPMESRGSSRSIIGMGTTESDSVAAGQYNPIKVRRYDDGENRDAVSTAENRITGELLGGYKAQGLQVFEVVPGADGTWNATVGNKQSIQYRVRIERNGEMTLISKVDSDGEADVESDDEPVVDLGTLSDEELNELGKDILDEITNRGSDG